MTSRVIEEAFRSGNIETARAFEARLHEKGYKGEHGSVRTEEYLDKFITQDPAMLRVKKLVRALLVFEDPVLILGPSGTGKELIAQALHGPRQGQFIPINCTGLPEQLIESELFGYAKGAFTGASADKAGLVEEAAGGTIFLDEIGDMPKAMQAKLLRILEDMKGRRIGSNHEYNINCRFLFATNKAPRDCIREDLYYRIYTYTLSLSGLEDRRGDVELIAKSLHVEFPSEKLGGMALTGNVRELQAIVKRWMLERVVEL